jgi:murein DD-endopeptidase MepM/ murein hydrolase activator NlpD
VQLTAGHSGRTSTPTQAAVTAFDAASLELAAARAAAEAALAGLSETKVVVQRNDTLDAIFRRLEFSLVDLANILALDAARQKLNILRPGDELTLATRDGQLVALHRPLSISQTLKVERDDAAGFVASVEDVPVTRHVRSTAGLLESSLWAAGMSSGLTYATIGELSEIFRWDVDFHLDIRQGDAFTLVYEQLESEDGIVEDGHILAAEVVNAGRSFRAVRYEYAEGKSDYYTPDGLSLRKAFLKAPLKFSRISSVYNPRRRHPVLNTIRAHRGVDYAAATGTKVLAVGAGRVQFRGVSGGFGNLIEIAHSGPSKIVTRYAHLSRFAKDVKVGTRVEQGQHIGDVGSTGLATGPHLHFEFLQGGQHVDPQKAISNSEPGPPVPATERPKFDAQVAPLLARLNTAPAPVSTALATR